MRELLCVPQSSKERLRRSRTESSGAAPAIEELAGEARQVRPAGPRADQYQPGSDFSRAKRSGGRPALRLPRATFSHRRSACRPHTDHTQQKSEIAAPVSFTPIRDSRATFPFCHAMFFSLHEVENMHAICRYTQLAKKENQDYT